MRWQRLQGSSSLRQATHYDTLYDTGKGIGAEDREEGEALEPLATLSVPREAHARYIYCCMCLYYYIRVLVLLYIYI